MLGELEAEGRIVVCDLEAGVGTLLRLQPGQADTVVVVAEPSVKSIEVASRAATIASERSSVVVVANRVRDERDVEAIREVLGHHEVAVIPDDPSISDADKEGVAPIDAAPDAPGVTAIANLAKRLMKASATT